MYRLRDKGIKELPNLGMFPDIAEDYEHDIYLNYTKDENGKLFLTQSGERLFEILKRLCSNDHINVYPMVGKNYNGKLSFFRVGKNPKDIINPWMAACFEY